LAIFHLTATVISRARGQSAVAAAAYRSGTKLRDHRYGTTHHYAGRQRIAHAEIMAPEGTPAWAHDREALWNRVESAELRKDSQLARVIELGLPIELTPDECLALVREYVARVFVARGMIADLCIRRDNPGNPHAHVLLTLRDVTPSGFGRKARRWNGKANLIEWRAAWAERTNVHLARAGHSARVDHRTLEAQHIELTPSRRMGIGRAPGNDDLLPPHLTERMAEQRRIASDNGDAMLEDPALLLRALAHQRSTFTLVELSQFLRSRTSGSGQFDAVFLAVTRSPDLVALQAGADSEPRFTSRDLVDAAKSLLHRAVTMAARRGHGLNPLSRDAVLQQCFLSAEQRRMFEYLMSDGDAKALVLGANDDKDGLLAAVRHGCEAEGLQLSGVAISRSDAQHLQSRCGVQSQTLAEVTDRWQRGFDLPTRAGVLLIDGAEMIGLKALERLVGVVDKARAKLILVGDLPQFRAMNGQSPLQDVIRQIGLADA
jgi:Ti-type conjugative transfer relaxase TraA